MSYPVSVHVDPALTNRNRLTTAFRLILAIPHLILVGGAGIGLSYSGDKETSAGAEGGLLGAVVLVLAIVSWFTILFASDRTSRDPAVHVVLPALAARALAYLMLLVDAYPPFGDAPYPATHRDRRLRRNRRNRVTVAFRIFLAIPHFFVLRLRAARLACHDRSSRGS